MRAYRALLVALALALVAAVLAWAVSTDPGYVRIERGAWIVETSLSFAIVALVVGASVLALAIALVRWPLRAMIRRRRREGRRLFVRGALALGEGRPQRAEQLFVRASRLPTLRTPALLAAHDAARLRGDTDRGRAILESLAAQEDGAIVAAVRRAEQELAAGRAGAAIEMLVPLDEGERLPPAGARVLVDAYAARGRTREALPHLARLRRAHVMGEADYDRYEAGVLARAIAETSDAMSLRALWSELDRAQRRDPRLAVAYAQRAAALRLGDEVAREVEAVLERTWSEPLVAEYARLGGDPAPKLGWLERTAKARPDSPALLVAFGRVCREQALWGKAEDALQRALALGAGAGAYEELGQLYQAQGQHERAARAYANALAVERGEAPGAMLATGRVEALAPPALEQRDQHGVPRLPHG